jgi:hypothetical protein
MKNYALERRLLTTEYRPARRVGRDISVHAFIQCLCALTSIPVAIAVSCTALLRLKLFKLFHLSR